MFLSPPSNQLGFFCISRHSQNWLSPQHHNLQHILSGEIKKALHFHDKVAAQGFKLDQVSYGTLINGLYKIGQTRVEKD